MRSRTLGASDLEVSLAGLGCNAFGSRIDRAQSISVVHAALDRGITFFDTAAGYGGGDSERFLGEALAGRRDRAVIATKFGWGGERPASREAVLRSCDESLERLGTDVIDLYQLHFPDPDTPIAETLEAMDSLVKAGKVRHIGCSNFTADQITEAAGAAADLGLVPFISAQNRWSLLSRDLEAEVIPACERHGMGMLPYTPLAGGLLTGKYRRGEEPPPGSRFAGDRRRLDEAGSDTYDILEGLERVAAEHDVTLSHLALGWLAAQPVVASVIAGATRPEQVAANVEATLWEPSASTLAAIESATTHGVRT